MTYDGFIHLCIKNLRHNDPLVETQPYATTAKRKADSELADNLETDDIQDLVNSIRYLLPVDANVKDHIISVMEKSFEFRQAWILKTQPMPFLSDVLDVYPHFKNIDGLVSSFTRQQSRYGYQAYNSSS